MFWISGYRRLTAIRERGILAFLRRDLPSVAFVCILAAVLGVQLHNAIAESLFESQVRTVLHRQFDDASGFRLIGVRFDKSADATIVRAVIRGPKAPSAADVAAAQTELPAPPDGSRLRLRVRFVEVVIVTPRGPTLGGDEDEQ